MDESSLLQSLGQVSTGEAAEIFHDHLRGCVRQMICEVMAAEVTDLCGPKHSPSGGEVFRAGSSPGRVIFEGQREDVLRRVCGSARPTVRRANCRWPATRVPAIRSVSRRRLSER